MRIVSVGSLALIGARTSAAIGMAQRHGPDRRRLTLWPLGDVDLISNCYIIF